MSNQAKFFLRSAALGFAGGLRSQMPLLALSGAARRGNFAPNATGLLRHLRNRTVRFGSVAAAIGEAIADKTPYVPNRIEPGPLTGRIAIGAVSGAVLAKGNAEPVSAAFAIGGLAAAIGSFAGYGLRTKVGPKLGLPDLPVALAEDAAALLIATAAVRPL
jgi:uncharacterized membrane protein